MADKATLELRERLFKGFIISLTGLVGLAGILLWVFFSAGISLIVVKGSSMETTVSDGDLLVLSQAREVEKGMLVVFPKPDEWGYMDERKPELLKRIVAGGGSTVDYTNGKLFVDGELIYNLLAESYICKLPNNYSYTLTNNELFVLGDNHKESLDSLRILCDYENPESAFINFSETFAYGTMRGKF